MPLLGQAALLLGFDIVEASVDDHDDWHTHEHMPERLGVPGFLRGSRWKAVRGSPGYMVLYEVADLDVLTSAPYLERLNNPTPWTTRTMPAYRNMSRGLCRVRVSHGHGLGGQALVIRLRLPVAQGSPLAERLSTELLAPLALRRGVSSVHWLEGAVQAPMTQEQSMRGADRGVDSALIVTAYDESALAAIEADHLSPPTLATLGGQDPLFARLRLVHTVNAL